MGVDGMKDRLPPHVREPGAGIGFAWTAALCLLPACLWGVLAFGLAAVKVLVVSVGVSCLVELVLMLPGRRFTLADGTALLSGLLIGCSMPPGIALYVPAAASAFAMAVVKHSFGGLGGNWMNPAMAGRTFALFCWPAPAAAWIGPFTHPDALGSATPLAVLRGLPAGTSPWQAMASRGFPSSGLEAGAIDWFRRVLGISLPPGSVDLLVGVRAGAVGEASILLIAAGASILLAWRIIRWEIPAAVLGTFALLSWVCGGPSGTLFSGFPFHAVFSGGIVFCAFFSATDPVTSPMGRWGRILYAVGVGGVAFLLRRFGSQAEGAGMAVILMNCFVPLLDRWVRPRPFGASKGIPA
jgi:Na+-translocating ferredoxin:NAD+ oxidoreductase subunit D